MLVSPLKRIFDAGVSLIGLVASIPIIVVAMLAIRLETPGWPLFAQSRVGRGEKPFICYKLRTMYADTRQLPTHETRASAVTPLGAWLRKWKFDELPQLYNVLIGDMSLVGPRPCLLTQLELIRLRASLGVFTVRPGVTGLAQVSGIDMSDAKRLAAVDAQYVRAADFKGDLGLIVATVMGKGLGIDRAPAKPKL